MKPKHRHLRIVVAALSLFFVPLHGQTNAKNGGRAQSGPSLAASQSVVSSIKCSDPETSSACKSFKQLVTAKDKDFLSSLFGDAGIRTKHISYVCFRPKSDVFQLIDFDIPANARFMNLSDAGTSLLDMGFDNAFPGSLARLSSEHNLQAYLELRKYWEESGRGDFETSTGLVRIQTFTDGVSSYYGSEWGRWKRPGLHDDEKGTNGELLFEGGNFLIAKHNRDTEAKTTIPDNPELEHIGLTGADVFIQYSFENRNNEKTDYILSVRRSTGRFTETFKSQGVGTDSSSGICLIFNR